MLTRMRGASGAVLLSVCAMLATACTRSGERLAGAANTVADAGVAMPAAIAAGVFADTVQSVVIPDPYRVLEDTLQPAVREWIAAQRAYTDSVLTRVGGVHITTAALERQAKSLPALDVVRDGGGRTFVTRWLSSAPSLFVIDSVSARERLLLDATAFAKGAPDRTMRAFVVSWDGSKVALGSTDDGDAGAAVHVLDVATSARLNDRIADLFTSTSGTRYQVSWLPDGSGFFYPRLWPGAARGAPAERLARGRQFLHRIGAPQSEDVPVFGFGVSPDVPFDMIDVPTRVLTAEGSPWLVASVYRAKRSGTDFYAAPLPADARGVPVWRQIAKVDDRLASLQLRGDTLFALSRKRADRGEVVMRVLRVQDDSSATWTTVLGERRGVLTAFTVQRDAIYAAERVAGATTLLRRAHGDTTAVPVTLPASGTVRLHAGRAAASGVLLAIESWATVPAWYRVAGDGRHVTRVVIDDGISAKPIDGVVSTQLEAKSADGTLVPVSIAYGPAALRNGKLDGTAPLLIDAYGGFGTATDPFFNPTVQTWVALGGVFAYAHVRGGGELGDAWHTSGMREQKQHSIADMIGAIEALIAKRFTSAGRVALTGTSFGATIPGHVMLQRPDLLGVAIYDVGQPDEIRGSALDPTAARNIAEVGDMDTPAGVRSLVKASPYHQVPGRVRLPAVIVHSASEDYNFGTQMLTAKFVARLQAANTGSRPVLWWQTGGGHREILTLDPALAATAYAFLLWQTGTPGFQPAARMR